MRLNAIKKFWRQILGALVLESLSRQMLILAAVFSGPQGSKNKGKDVGYASM